MKRFSILCLAALAILVSCHKESDTVTLGATIENLAGTAKLYIDANRTPQWENSDPVWINGNGDYSVTLNGTTAQISNVVRDGNNHYLAVFPADMVASGQTGATGSVSLILPREQQFQSSSQAKVPMIAYTTTGRTLDFKNLCSLLKLTVRNSTANDITLSRITLTATNALLSGPVTASIQGGEAQLGTWGDEAEHDVSLCFPPSQTLAPNCSIDCYMVVPEFSASEVSIIAYTTDGHFFPLLKNSVSLQHNSIATVSVNIAQLLTAHDLFTVDGSGTTVRFAPGNLQYSRQGTHTTADGTADGTWRFAKHQYDIVGSDNSNISNTNYTGWIDLFGWGTSGYSGKAPTTASTNINDYYKKNNLTGLNYDWGLYNTIGNDAPGSWHTLSSAEWDWIFESRTGVAVGTANNVRFALAKVNGVNGVMLIPDSFTWPSAITDFPTVVTTNNIDWNNTDFSLAKWSVLESAGIVFLPAAGYRNGTIVGGVNFSAQYWSSTLNNRNYGLSVRLWFEENRAPVFTGSTEVFNGFSVRLVQTVLP